MTDNPNEKGRSPFLDILEKMAADRSKPLAKFVSRIRLMSRALEFLRTHPWFRPSNALVDALWEAAKPTDDERAALVHVMDAGNSLDIEATQSELAHICEFLPLEHRSFVLDVARKQLELVSFFKSGNIPDSYLGITCNPAGEKCD